MNNKMISILNRYLELNKSCTYQERSIIESIQNIFLLNEDSKKQLSYLDKVDITGLSTQLLQKFLDAGYFINNLLEISLQRITDLLNSELKLPYALYVNKHFIQKFISTYDIQLFRNSMDMLEKNNIYLKEYIERKMYTKYNNIYENINEDGIYIEYIKMYEDVIKYKLDTNTPKFMYNLVYITSQKEYKKSLKYNTEILLLDCLIDKHFNDNKNNVLLNIENLLEFNKKTNIIPKTRIEIYNKILNFYNLSLEEKKTLYYSIPNNMKEQFYDDFKTCRDKQANMLNESFIDLNKIKFTILDNVKIYELKGEEFYIPIHNTSIKRTLSINPMRKARIDDTLSISIISDYGRDTYRPVEDYISFGFKEINKDRIIHVYPGDSYTHHRKGSNLINMLLTPKELILYTDAGNKQPLTSKYNEILLLEDETIKVDYLICYDDIKKTDLELAKKMHIPIVVIYTKYYKKTKEKIKSKLKGKKYNYYA